MREVLDFCEGWLFHQGDVDTALPAYKGAAYMSAKTERYHVGPACKNYFAAENTYANNTEHKTDIWTKVTLPHDYVITETPEKRYNNAHGFVPYDNAWYIKKFDLPESDLGRRIVLLFDGVTGHATVYLNGCLMKHNFCGYNGFEVDISDMAVYGGRNTLSVYVDNREREGWWYEGGGIYRAVRMIKTEQVSLDLYGIFVCPSYLGEGKWNVPVELTLRNDSIKRKVVRVRCRILDADGDEVAQTEISGRLSEKDKRVLSVAMSVTDPARWSPETPVQYTLEATVYCGTNAVDTQKVRFGFRTLRVDANKGLFINDRHYKIKGVCGHADCGLLGKAVPDNVHRYKVKLMKEMGANGYRTTHYPQAEALMDALDDNGFIVIDETRWYESTEEGLEQLTWLIKRDRNRPGVVFWSIGNEEPHHATEQGRRIARGMVACVKKLDPSRFVTTAVCSKPTEAPVNDEVDVIGVNYKWGAYDILHEKYPDKPIMSTECCATGTTRGWYFPQDDNRAFLPAYDRDSSEEFMSREGTWKFITDREWMLGGYQWIAFEHRGEAIWPRLCSQSGAIDLFLQKKDAFYQNQSHWLEEPMLHLLPHWNFAGLEGEAIRVVAYTNQPEAELFVNGESVGRQSVPSVGHAEWTVPYTKGKIEAVAYGADGKVTASDCRVTTGRAAKLMLTMETDDVCANGKDIAILSCYAVDDAGNEVPDAEMLVRFTADGVGQVYATGSDITEHTTPFSPDRRMRAGRIGVAVKLGTEAGRLRVIASADGMESAVLSVEIPAAPEKEI